MPYTKPCRRHALTYPVILLFLVHALSVNAQVATIVKAPLNKRVLLMWRIVGNRDTGLVRKTYDSIADWSAHNGDRKLLYLTQLASFENSIELNHDEQPLLLKADYFEKCGIEEVIGAYHFVLGNAFYYQRNYDKAFAHIVKAVDVFENVGFNKLSLSSTYANHLFGFYFFFEDFSSALKYCNIAIAYTDDSIENPVFALNNLGVIYLKLKNYDSAAHTFSRVMSMSQSIHNTAFYGIGSGNYGNVLRLQGRFAEALPFLYTDVRLNQEGEPGNSAITCLYISYCLLKLDSVAKAATYLATAKRYFNRTRAASPDWPFSGLGMNYYETASLYYRKTGDFKKASNYQDTLLHFKDSLKNIYNTRIVMATTLRSKEEKLLEERKIASAESAHIRMVRNIIITSLVLLFFAVGGFIVLKRNQERELAKERQLRYEEMLTSANAKLDQYLTNIIEKNELIEQIEKELLELQPINAANDEETKQRLQGLRNAVIMTDDNWATFKTLFEQVYPNFFNRIRSKYENLNYAEERLLSLSKLKLSSKDMANMQGISVESLRKSRYRLRKKFPMLAADEEFSEII